MRILEVGRYKKEYVDNILPFIKEQGESLHQAGCEVDYFRVRGNYVLAVRELKAKIEEFRPDIVHAHYGLSCITAELQSLVPVVSTFHNGEWHSAWVNFASSLMAKRAKHLIYVAPHVREKMYFKHPHYTILPCGVNMEKSKPTDYIEARQQLGFDPNTKYILFGGAFSNTRKNVALLNEAIKQVKSATTSETSDRLNEVNGEEVRGKIVVMEMKGMDRKTVALYMSACDLFALPTKNEGSPQALKEAMACNCPIVATDCADIAYLLGEVRGKNEEVRSNLLVGHYLLSNKGKSKAEWVGDESSVAELAELLKQALSLPAGFRTNGRKRIEELGYTNELVAKKLIEIYTSVLDK